MGSTASKKTLNFDKVLPWLLIVGGTIGFLASFILTLDKIHILQNPGFEPLCNINPIISCGSVMKTSQSAVFGFANSLIGVAAYAGVITVGMSLLAKATFQRWFWVLVQTGATFGVIFIHWLIFESLYRLGTLCPYCMAVWTVTIPIFWYMTLFNASRGNIPSVSSDNRIVSFALRHHGDVLVAWFLIIVALIVIRFWYYFGF